MACENKLQMSAIFPERFTKSISINVLSYFEGTFRKYFRIYNNICILLIFLCNTTNIKH